MITNSFNKLSNILFSVLLGILVFAANTSETSSTDTTFVRKKLISSFTKKDSSNSLKSFQNQIDKILDHKHLNKTKFSVLVYSLQKDDYLYQKDPNLLLTPASLTKLFTSFSIYANLGRQFRLHTGIYTDGRQMDSVLNGNLYLVGRGDPYLSTSDLEKIAEIITNLGVKRITGNIYADGSFFDEMTSRREYSGDKDNVQATPPITGLSIERNTVTVLVNAGNKLGEKVKVQTFPPSEAFEIINSAKVGGKSRRKKSISISSKMGSNGVQRISVSGQLQANRSYSYRYYIENPALVAAGTLKNRLENGGIFINGKIGQSSIPDLDSSVVLQPLGSFSRPVSEIIYEMNKESNNYLAESLFKMLGAYFGNSKHNADGAENIVFNRFKQIEIQCEKCMINDGSGLSRRNLVKADAILNMLLYARKSGFYHEFDSSLSIAGIDGTLRKRMIGTHAENNLRGKTGTLRNVSGLAGYVKTLDNDLLAFVFLFNGPNVGVYKEIENELGEALSSFFYFNEES